MRLISTGNHHSYKSIGDHNLILHWSCLSNSGLEKDNVVTTIERWGPDFEISFKLKVNKMPQSEGIFGPYYYSVLQMTDGDTTNGDKNVPAVWLFENNGKLLLHTQIMNSEYDYFEYGPVGNDYWEGDIELELKKVYTVLLTQKGGTFKVTVDGNVLWQNQTGIAEPFTDVKYHLSNPWQRSAGDLAQITTPLLASPQQWDGQWDGMGQRKPILEMDYYYYYIVPLGKLLPQLTGFLSILSP